MAAALFKLISDAKVGKISMDMYIFKYITITDTLIKKNAMSKYDRSSFRGIVERNTIESILNIAVNKAGGYLNMMWKPQSLYLRR